VAQHERRVVDGRGDEAQRLLEKALDGLMHVVDDDEARLVEQRRRDDGAEIAGHVFLGVEFVDLERRILGAQVGVQQRDGFAGEELLGAADEHDRRGAHLPPRDEHRLLRLLRRALSLCHRAPSAD